MMRIIFLFCLLGSMVGVAVWLSDNPGSVTINWLGYEIETYFGVLLVVSGVLLVVLWTINRIINFVLVAPRNFISAREKNRQLEGYQALTLGMAAIAAGDREEAGRFSKQANKLLRDPIINKLLLAQTAALNGDQSAALKYFETLNKSQKTRFIGLVGLIRQAKLSGDKVKIRELTQEAYNLRPESVFVVETLFDLQTQSGSWEEAKTTLFDAVKRKVKPESVAMGPRVTILTALAYEKETEEDYKTAIEYADKALQDERNFVPAAIIRTQLIHDISTQRKAVSLIESFCKRNPHSQVISEYLKLWPDETSLQRFQRLQSLGLENIDDLDIKLLFAEVALNAKLWGEARKYLDLVINKQLTNRTCLLMSQLEQLENQNDDESRKWLERTADAVPDTSWVCRSCGAVAHKWTALCGNCGNFDSVIWKKPPTIGSLSSATYTNGTLEKALEVKGA